ncbi:MAG: HAD-IA family hydrolase [Actinomycetota bacterium]
MTDAKIVTIDGVLFDSDGVLVDSHVPVEQAWSTICERYGLDAERVLTELIGVRAADTLGRHLPADRVDEAVALLEDLEVETAPGTPTIVGAAELLAALDPDRWTIVTSASRRLARARWAGAGIPLPDRPPVTAEDVTEGKPSPEPFLTGAARLGIDPARCLVFEDSPSGGRAAVASGAVVVAVGRQAWPVTPWARIDDLSAIEVVDDPSASAAGITVRVASP